MAQVFQDDGGHGHAQCSKVILRRHFFLPGRIHQKTNQGARQVLCVSRFVKVDCDLFALSHLAEIGQIGAHNRHTVGASQVGNSAAASGGRIGHHGDCRHSGRELAAYLPAHIR